MPHPDHSIVTRGYYVDRGAHGDVDEVTFVSGTRAGNYYYNPWADEPHWAPILFAALGSLGEYSATVPDGIPAAPGAGVADASP